MSNDLISFELIKHFQRLTFPSFNTLVEFTCRVPKIWSCMYYLTIIITCDTHTSTNVPHFALGFKDSITIMDNVSVITELHVCKLNSILEITSLEQTCPPHGIMLNDAWSCYYHRIVGKVFGMLKISSTIVNYSTHPTNLSPISNIICHDAHMHVSTYDLAFKTCKRLMNIQHYEF